MFYTQRLFFTSSGTNPLPPGDIVIDNETPTAEKTIYLYDGVYKIEIVGGGSGGNHMYISNNGPIWYGGGGSGAAFVGEFHILEGEYKYATGSGGSVTGNAGGDSYILRTSDNFGIIAGGGKSGGYANGGNEGGTLTIASGNIVGTPQVNSNGNTGNGWSYSGESRGGASLYGGFGYGGSSLGSGGGGLLKITFIRDF